MTNRRKFFQQFIGQFGVLRDDIKGVEKIPLNRLNELPEKIIDEIIPVFFTDEEWKMKEDSIILLKEKNKERNQIHLSLTEKLVFNFFEQGNNLKEASLNIETELKIPYEEAHQTVTSLFFKLASNRICHPRKIYKIDELAKNQNNNE